MTQLTKIPFIVWMWVFIDWVNITTDFKEFQMKVLDESKLRDYVEQFNIDDEELYSNISNEETFNFLYVT